MTKERRRKQTKAHSNQHNPNRKEREERVLGSQFEMAKNNSVGSNKTPMAVKRSGGKER